MTTTTEQQRNADDDDREEDAAAAAQEEGEGEEEEEEDEEDEDEDDRDCFFESFDRVPSGVSFALDFPSSGSEDDDEFDDVRISFASAIGSAPSFRRVSFAARPQEPEFAADERRAGQGFDYGIWLAAEPVSIQERRRRLLQGMGLASGRDLNRSRSGQPPPPSRLSSCAATPASPGKGATAAAATASAPLSRRCRSDSELEVAPRHSPFLSRANSAPPALGIRRESEEESAGKGLADDDAGAGLALEACGTFRIKNLDTGKEFVLSDISQDGTSGRLSDVQSGVQLTLEEFEKFLGFSPIVKELMRRVNLGGGNGKKRGDSGNQAAGAKNSKSSGGRKMGGWLKNIKFVASSVTGFKSEKEKGDANATAAGKSSGGNSSSEFMKVHQSGKSCKEFSGLYMCQEIHAHQGPIWSMKFSPDSQYLASAGEDRVVNVWQVTECSSSLRRQESFARPPLPSPAHGSPDRPGLPASQPPKKTKRTKSSKRSIPDYVVLPETIFSLSEKPVCSFLGHQDDVLDLSWSKSQHLLSSSMDKTVRLWDMDSKACLKLFAHNDYVTCIQFNPVDDRYFISGSLDGKVRIWSIPDRQVVDWSDLHEMVTAVCYTPDGQGAFVGSHKGSCRYYKTSDCKLCQEAQIDIRHKKKKSHTKKITGFQFAPDNPSEVLVTSADSQIRVFDGVDMFHKFRGFKNTSSQISASYTSDGKYVVCASEDSHVYIWKRDATRNMGARGKSKGWSNTRSHEHFYCKDVLVAIPWPNGGTNCEPPHLPLWSVRYSPSSSQRQESADSHICNSSLEDNYPSGRSNGPPLPRGSSEQSLSSLEEACNVSRCHSESEVGSGSSLSASASLRSGPASSSISDSSSFFSSSLTSWGWYSGGSSRTGISETENAWGLVVVTASLGGDIRIYQNFGLPLRLSRQTNLF